MSTIRYDMHDKVARYVKPGVIAIHWERHAHGIQSNWQWPRQ